MAEPTFEEVFGAGTQRIASGTTTTESGLFIPDSTLVAGGLSSPESKSAEAHFAAILLTSKSTLTEANFNANLDQSIYIEDGFNKSFVNRGENNNSYRLDPFTLNLTKLDNQATLNPGDY